MASNCPFVWEKDLLLYDIHCNTKKILQIIFFCDYLEIRLEVIVKFLSLYFLQIRETLFHSIQTITNSTVIKQNQNRTKYAVWHRINQRL